MNDIIYPSADIVGVWAYPQGLDIHRQIHPDFHIMEFRKPDGHTEWLAQFSNHTAIGWCENAPDEIVTLDNPPFDDPQFQNGLQKFLDYIGVNKIVDLTDSRPHPFQAWVATAVYGLKDGSGA